MEELLIEASFNSIKVRLRQPIFGFTLETLKFQFHKGTIKTPYIGNTLVPITIDINAFTKSQKKNEKMSIWKDIIFAGERQPHINISVSVCQRTLNLYSWRPKSSVYLVMDFLFYAKLGNFDG